MNWTKLGIDFNQLEGEKTVEQVMNTTINAGVYYEGTGNVNIDKSIFASNISFNKFAISNLINKIRNCKELESNKDAEDELITIENELNKATPSSKIIKKSLLFLKDVAVNIGANMAAQYITSALGLF